MILFGGVLSLWALARSGYETALVIACAFVLFPGALALVTRFRTQRIKAVQVQFLAGGVAPLASSATQPAEMVRDSRYPERPRRVRLSWRGWVYSAGVSALLVALIFFFSLIFRDDPVSIQTGKGLLVLACFSFYTVLCIWFFRNRWTEHGLLSEGRYASGVVLEQQEQSRSLPRISYSFRDFGGRGVRAKVTDFSRQLYEGMPVSVFYDEADPAKSVALESSLFSID